MTAINRAASMSLRGDTRQAVTSLKRVEQAQRRLGTSFDATAAKTARANRAMMAMGKEAGRLRGAMAGRLGLAGGILGVGMALDAWADRAVEVNNVYKTLKISIDGARDAVAGQVDKLTLAKNANKLHLAGLKVTSDQYETLAGVVAKASDATGQDLAQNLDKATRAIASGNVEAMARMGLTLDQRTAEREYAEQLGKSVTELTKAEKSQIALNLVLTKGVEQTNAMGSATGNAATAWVDLKNQMQDALDDVIRIRENFGEFAKTLRQDVEGAMYDIGLKGDLLGTAWTKLENLSDAKWALIAGDIDYARIQLERFLAVADTGDLVSEMAYRAADKRIEKLQGDIARRVEESQKQRLQQAAASAGSEQDEAGGGGRTGRGGRGRGRPTVAAANQDFYGSFDVRGAANTIGVEHEREQAEQLEEIRRTAHERRVERHEQILRMQEEQMRAQEEHRRAIVNWAETGVQAYGDIGSAMVNLAALSGASGKKQQQIQAVTEGSVLLAKAVSHQIQAGMAFASFNIPLGLGHQAAAIAGFTNAAVFMSGQVPGGGRGGGRAVGGGHGSGMRGAARIRGEAGSTAKTTGGGMADSPIPLSAVDKQFAASSGVGAGGGTTVINNSFHHPFVTKKDIGRAIDQSLREFKKAGGTH